MCVWGEGAVVYLNSLNILVLGIRSIQFTRLLD